MNPAKVYNIPAYGAMIADKARTDAYARALELAVRPSSVVLDIGAGTGIASLLACKYGARKVYAVEPSDAIQVAREIATANGLEGRIEFIQDFSTRIDLPERADVMVSDLHGALPFFSQHIPSIVDARRRLLAPGGIQIPQRDTLWSTVVEAPDLYARQAGPWGESPFGFDMMPARSLAVNSWRRSWMKPEAMLTGAQQWGLLDYTTVEDSNFKGSALLRAERGGTGHGLGVWFDGMLADTVGFSNSPRYPESIYGSPFFPWVEPVEIQPGDTIRVEIQANLIGEDYIWEWNTVVFGQGSEMDVKAQFRQSTFFGFPISPERLRKRSARFVPRLGPEGEIDNFALSLMNNEQTLERIAAQLVERFPRRFARAGTALDRVTDLAQKYC